MLEQYDRVGRPNAFITNTFVVFLYFVSVRGSSIHCVGKWAFCFFFNSSSHLSCLQLLCTSFVLFGFAASLNCCYRAIFICFSCYSPCVCRACHYNIQMLNIFGMLSSRLFFIVYCFDAFAPTTQHKLYVCQYIIGLIARNEIDIGNESTYSIDIRRK